MKVELEISFGYNTGKGVFDATIKTYLPLDSYNYLHPLLYNKEYHFYDTWGSYDGEKKMRYTIDWIEDKNFNELKKKTQKFVEDRVSLLRKVYRTNLKNTKQAQKEKTKIFVFSL